MHATAPPGIAGSTMATGKTTASKTPPTDDVGANTLTTPAGIGGSGGG